MSADEEFASLIWAKLYSIGDRFSIPLAEFAGTLSECDARTSNPVRSFICFQLVARARKRPDRPLGYHFMSAKVPALCLTFVYVLLL